MKTLLLTALTLTVLGLASVTDLPAQTRVYKARDLAVPAELDPEKVKDAGNVALKELLETMLASNDLPKKFAILPLERDVDNGYFTMQMRNFFTNQGQQNGYELYTRNDAEWNKILEEIKWGDQFGDTMDAATVQKFGHIKGVQGLLMGRISSISTNDKGEPVVRVTVQAFEVETGRQVWGNEAKGVIKENGEKKSTEFTLEQIPGGWMAIAGGIIGIFLLFVIIRAIGKAARPR